MQSRRGSLAEAIISTVVGFALSMLAYEYIFPKLGIQTTTVQNFQIVVFMTLISLARQYVFRRFFNNLTVKRMLRNG
jgi:hypothetical protein